MIINKLLLKMINYNAGDIKRITHSIKVHQYAKLIGECEDLNDETRFILESSAILHDIGIKNCEIKYNSTSGKLQEKEGPIVASEILTSLNYSKKYIEKINHHISNHHSYNNIDSLSLQILIEADFLVNLEEESSSKEVQNNVYNKIFKTKTGKELMKKIYGI